MNIASIMLLITIGLLILLGVVGFVVIIVIIINAVKKSSRNDETKSGKATIRKSLGETIKDHRINCNMTQEFVAESIGVSRQAVSKWENGTSDPSTSNLFALAKLFNVNAEVLLKIQVLLLKPMNTKVKIYIFNYYLQIIRHIILDKSILMCLF